MGRKLVMTGKGVNFRLTEAERSVLDRAAERDGVSTPQWIKHVALREARAPERWREVEVALRAVGVDEATLTQVLGALQGRNEGG